jgi:hypothetical protein
MVRGKNQYGFPLFFFCAIVDVAHARAHMFARKPRRFSKLIFLRECHWYAHEGP